LAHNSGRYLAVEDPGPSARNLASVEDLQSVPIDDGYEPLGSNHLVNDLNTSKQERGLFTAET